MDSSVSENETLQDCEKSGPAIDRLPAKSREKYLKAYELFMEWRATVGAKDFSENVLLAYFKELAKTKKSPTLWVNYSMLRATVSANNNVHINGYSSVLSFLKSQAKGHKSKKSKVFTAEDIETFLREAPDELYLDVKVVLIFGISGACRAVELIRIKPADVVKHSDQALLVNLCITGSPSKIERSFVIRNEYVKIVEKYQAMRPLDTELNRFFLNYQNGKCTRQAIGKHKLSDFPKRIAQYLNLPNPELYTGHCLRRTSASLLVQSGADAVLLKQCGGWRSTHGVAEYLEGSYTKRIRIDAPRIRALPIENLQESALDETQHLESSTESLPFESILNNTQPTSTQWSDIEHTEINQSTDSVQQVSKQETQLETESKTQQDSMLNDIQTQLSECVDDCQSVKTDDPFDLIPDEYVMPPSPRRAPPQPPPPRQRPPTSPFRQLAALERRRLRLDEVRARQLHARETRRLRVEARRIEVDKEKNEVLKRIADIAQLWLERLSRP